MPSERQAEVVYQAYGKHARSKRETRFGEVFFTDLGEAKKHAVEAYNHRFGFDASPEDFEQVNNRVWKIKGGAAEAYVVRPKIYDTVEQAHEVLES